MTTIKNKIIFYQNVIQKTLLHINKTGSEIIEAINSLFKVNEKLQELSKKKR